MGWDAVERREQQREIRHCWEAKLGILSACSTGDVWRAPLLDLLIPGSSNEGFQEPGVP